MHCASVGGWVGADDGGVLVGGRLGVRVGSSIVGVKVGVAEGVEVGVGVVPAGVVVTVSFKHSVH